MNDLFGLNPTTLFFYLRVHQYEWPFRTQTNKLNRGQENIFAKVHSFFYFKIFANIASVNSIFRRNLDITQYVVISLRLAAGQCKKYF